MLHSRISLQTAVRSVLQSYKSLEFLGTSEQGQLTLIGALKGPQAGISMSVFSDIGELDPNVRDFHTVRLKRDHVHKLVTGFQNGTPL